MHTIQRIILQTIITYFKRRDRDEHPKGLFKDRGDKRWYPVGEEIQECCKGLKQPTHQFPYSQMSHCRTLKHICNLYKLTDEQLEDTKKWSRFFSRIKLKGTTIEKALEKFPPDQQEIDIKTLKRYIAVANL